MKKNLIQTRIGNPFTIAFLNVLLVLVLVICNSTELFAQTFMPAYNPSFGYKEGYVLLKDGSKLDGTFTLIFHLENIKNCTVKDANGTKHKIKGEDIDRVFIKFSKMDKLSTLNESISSLQVLNKTDFNQVFDAEYFIWEHAMVVKKKKAKTKVLQLVNPGFDSKIKVYRDPNAQETAELSVGGVTLTGGIEKSYFLIKSGTDIAIQVTKKGYSEQFNTLFGDCPELIELYKEKKPVWDDFPAHVYAYDQLTCSSNQ